MTASPLPRLTAPARRSSGGRTLTALLAIALLVLTSGCDDEDPSNADAGTDAGSDAGSDAAQDTTADTTADTNLEDTPLDTPGDTTDASDTPVDPCAMGATASAEVGSEISTLELCTATLTLTTAAFAEGTTVTLSIVDPPDAPFERALISPAYNVAADDELLNVAPLHIVDSSEAEGYREMAWYNEEEAAWWAFEACPEGDGLTGTVFELGTYALFRDTFISPEGPTGLGDGTLESQLGEDEPLEWGFEDGYAIHDVSEDGSRSVTVVGRIDVEGGLLNLDLRFSQSAEGEVGVLQISLIDTTDVNGSWSYLEPVHGPITGDSTLEATEDGLTGTFTTTVYQGEDVTEEITITLDVTTERFRYPPEGACFPPEG